MSEPVRDTGRKPDVCGRGYAEPPDCSCDGLYYAQHDYPGCRWSVGGQARAVGMVETWINGRWPLWLPPHRAERPEWPWWEATRLAAMAHHLGGGLPWRQDRQHELVYDIGTEEGDLPALWASWGCDVLLVEPNPRVWPNIKAIFQANDLSERVAGCFVGFASDETAFHSFARTWPDCADGPLIGDHGFLNLAERPDVQRVTIDDLARLGRSPTAITIDVEGAELAVLRGAAETLRRDQPKVWVSIHPEFMAEMYGVDDGIDAVRALMAEHDYEERFLATDHEHHWQFLPR